MSLKSFKFLGQILHLPKDEELYANVAVACNEHDGSDGHFYSIRPVDNQPDTYECYQLPDPTKEELEAQELQALKNDRADKVSKIKVDVDGMVFDGDEIAQSRMSRTVAIAVAHGYDMDKTKRTWVLADNTVAEVSIRQLSRACELAGNKQTELWTVPYV